MVLAFPFECNCLSDPHHRVIADRLFTWLYVPIMWIGIGTGAMPFEALSLVALLAEGFRSLRHSLCNGATSTPPTYRSVCWPAGCLVTRRSFSCRETV